METNNVTHRKQKMTGTFVNIKNGTMVLTTNKGKLIGSYPLSRVTRERILRLRLSMQSACIIKANDKFAFTNVQHDLNLSNAFAKHLCTKCIHCLARNNNNGCKKVYDLSPSEFTNISRREAIKKSKRLEKYDFIKRGIETFGCYPYNAFIVLQCDNFEADKTPDL